MPDLFYQTLDQVPEGLREFASETDGKVKVSVVAKVKLDEFRENNVKLSQERDALKTAVEKARTVFGEDFDAAAKEFGDLRGVAQRVKDGELVENKGLDEALAERTKQMREGYESQVTERAREANAWKEKATALDTRLKRTFIDRAITDVVLDSKSGVEPKAVTDILGRAYSIFQVSDDGKLTPKNGDAILYGADGASPMTPAEWVATLKDAAPHYFKGSSGGGASGGDAKMPNGMSQAEFAKLSPMQRLRAANGEKVGV